MTDHERIEEMMAAQALGGLSAADEAELELLRAEHSRDCRECRRLESAYGDVAGRLAFALDPEPVPARMAEDILQRAEREGPLTAPRAVRPGGGRRLAVAATAALLLVAGGVGGQRRVHTSSAYLVYVALDEEGKPRPVPPVIAQTAHEQRRQREAKLRREARLARKEAIRAARGERD